MARALLQPHGPHLWTLQVSAPQTQLREGARDLVREALQAHLPALLSSTQVKLISEPGQPPRLAAPHEGVGISIAHESGLSLVAIHLQGPVGVDLMRVLDMPDALVVAHAYLGPDVAEALEALPPPEQVQAFAQAWTAHEARLKCLGMPLQEWHEGLDEQLRDCELQAVDVSLRAPAPMVANLAWR